MNSKLINQSPTGQSSGMADMSLKSLLAVCSAQRLKIPRNGPLKDAGDF